MKKIVGVMILFIMVALYVGGCRKANTAEAMSVAITKENFPEKRMREEIAKKFDKNKDGILAEEELRGATKLELDSETINLQGIPKLKYITTLNVEADTIENMSEIAKMPQLVILRVDTKDDDIDMFDFSKNAALKELAIYADIKKLRLPNSKNLQSLTLYESRIKKLSLNGFLKLKKIKLCYNDIQTIAVTNCPELEKISSTEDEKLERVTVKNLPELECLKIGSSKKLKKLKLSHIPEMRELVLGRNSIKKIDFKQMPKLRILTVRRNKKITKLDLRPLRKLQELTWQRGKLKKIRFGQKKNLRFMYLQHNRLGGTWKLSKFLNLEEFYCSYNRIKNIYGRNNKFLDGVECEHNRLKKLDLYNIEPGHIWFKGNPYVKAYLIHSSGHATYYRFDKSAKVYYKYKD